MKRAIILWLAVLVIAPLLIGCQTESRNLVPAPVDYGVEQNQVDGVKIEINAMVDILFVIDDSGSMRAHQARFAANIDRFVEGFGKNSLIDFHIGVLSVYDSRRYGEYDVAANKVVGEGIVKPVDRNNKPLFDPIGHLRPLKAPAGKEHLLANQGSNFVRKSDGFVDVLRESLKIGVREYNKNTTFKTVKRDGRSESVLDKEASGPEFEEVFTPVMAALRPPVSTSWNKGFLRERAHLVVVFVTDANDASMVSASQMYRFLVDLKGAGNFTIFGVINPTQQPLACDRDPAGPPAKIEDLIRMTNGRILNICANYAQELADVGKMIQDRTLKEIRIPLARLPVVETIEVSYGQAPIPPGQWQGWTYDGDSEQKAIVIRGAANWSYQPGAKIEVRFQPVDPTRPTSFCLGCPKN